MFDSLKANTLDQTQVVVDLIPIHKAHSDQNTSDVRLKIKLYAVSSCVTRLYAIYEKFVETIIADYLDALPEIIPFQSLDAELKSEYRIGISHVLSRIEHERYRHLKHESVILWYHQALTGEKNYRFVSEALIRHDKNLRLSELEALMGRIRLSGIRNWLNKNDAVVSLYNDTESVFDQLTAELKTFIQIRNDAAHGVLEDLVGKDNLERFCELIKSLIEAISSFLHHSLVVQKASAGKFQKIGDVVNVYKKSGAFVAEVKNGIQLKKGMQVHVLGVAHCVVQEVSSMQVDDADVQTIVSEHDGFKVGMKFAVQPKPNSELYLEL